MDLYFSLRVFTYKLMQQTRLEFDTTMYILTIKSSSKPKKGRKCNPCATNQMLRIDTAQGNPGNAVHQAEGRHLVSVLLSYPTRKNVMKVNMKWSPKSASLSTLEILREFCRQAGLKYNSYACLRYHWEVMMGHVICVVHILLVPTQSPFTWRGYSCIIQNCRHAGALQLSCKINE